MICWDMCKYLCIKKIKNSEKCIPVCQTYKPTVVILNLFPNSRPTYRKQVGNLRHQTLQQQSVAKPGTPL